MLDLNIVKSIIHSLTNLTEMPIAVEQFDKSKSKQIMIKASGGSDNRDYEIGGDNYFSKSTLKLCFKIQQELEHIEWMFNTFNKIQCCESKILKDVQDSNIPNIQALDIKFEDIAKDEILQKSFGLVYSSVVTVYYYFSNEVL